MRCHVPLYFKLRVPSLLYPVYFYVPVSIFFPGTRVYGRWAVVPAVSRSTVHFCLVYVFCHVWYFGNLSEVSFFWILFILLAGCGCWFCRWLLSAADLWGRVWRPLGGSFRPLCGNDTSLVALISDFRFSHHPPTSSSYMLSLFLTLIHSHFLFILCIFHHSDTTSPPFNWLS